MYLYSNLATSLDGKIATGSREFFPLGTPYDRRRMIQIRKKSDAIIMGAESLRTFRRPLLVSGARNQKLNIVLSRNLQGVSSEWPFFRSKKIRRVLLVEKVSPRRRTPFESTSEIVELGPKVSAKKILKALEKFGVKKLLVEGGGGTMWLFAKDNLIDEYFVTLTPRILGGTDAPTLVDGVGLSAQGSLRLKLNSCRRVGDELYLHYQKRR